jgi:hypothetical protein
VRRLPFPTELAAGRCVRQYGPSRPPCPIEPIQPALVLRGTPWHGRYSHTHFLRGPTHQDEISRLHAMPAAICSPCLQLSEIELLIRVAKLVT